MKAFGMTDVGKKRHTNQDAVFFSTEPIGMLPNLFIVCDGMGGHQAGDFASRFTIDHVVNMISQSDNDNPISILNECIRTVNDKVIDVAQSDEQLYGMGTTLVAACVIDDILYVANVGDSRLYMMNDGIRQITRDHSLVEELVHRGEIIRGSQEYNERKNIITRAIGARRGIFADFFEVTIEPGDTVLMCTDGLCNMVSDERIFEIAGGKGDLETTVRELIKEANENGGKDNIGIVMFSPMSDEVME